MATTPSFVDFVTGQLAGALDVSAKKLFGEYGLYAGGKLFGLVCDNQLFLKPTKAGRAFLGEVVEQAPYDGAKPAFLIDDKLEDSRWLSELVGVSLAELPAPKAKPVKG
ncbi:TfoX/Sxy family protein [Hymenobacter latericus]|uniref:TfoX/Sxy family protein n=1 Tax=Hymenobacter sp. YIM 151858-1 TaxID=2987688 RepID=UPI0022270660|nr:TfoX/Sxy family protein [Hymenobacter sp. YIM 151858-1]UYZ61182.1 TfoX/Sxy family protein [Hymenobacter sp. YIM 151858-1]